MSMSQAASPMVREAATDAASKMMMSGGGPMGGDSGPGAGGKKNEPTGLGNATLLAEALRKEMVEANADALGENSEKEDLRQEDRAGQVVARIHARRAACGFRAEPVGRTAARARSAASTPAQLLHPEKMTTASPVAQHIDQFRERFTRVTTEVGLRIVGNEELLENTVTALLAGGHVLLEGIPGVGQDQPRAHAGGRSAPEVLAHPVHAGPDAGRHRRHEHRAGARARRRRSSSSSRARFSRTSCSPTKSTARRRRRSRRCSRRCRSTACRSARRPTSSSSRSSCSRRRIRSRWKGTYPLPEAQLDRFFFKLKVTVPARGGDAPDSRSHHATGRHAEVARVMDGPEILEMRHVVRSVPIAKPVQGYAIRLTLGSHPESPYASPLVKRYVRYGASPRAAQALVLAGKIHATHARQRVRVRRRHPRRRDARACATGCCSTSRAKPSRSMSDTIVTELLAAVATE